MYIVAEMHEPAVCGMYFGQEQGHFATGSIFTISEQDVRQGQGVSAGVKRHSVIILVCLANSSTVAECLLDLFHFNSNLRDHESATSVNAESLDPLYGFE